MTEIKMKQIFEFCPCGKLKGHTDKCLSVKFGVNKDRVGKYSGKSKSPYGAYEAR